MRRRAKRNDAPSRERDEQLRSARAGAQPLRVAFPTASVVNVHLRFLPATAPLHAAQSFVLYPAAKAFFAYPCPYGDCDGIYDLAADAARALAGDTSRVTGVSECAGARSRDGLQRQLCGLRLSYTISATRESLVPAHPARRRKAGV